MKKQSIVFVGGHLAPAFAVIEVLQKEKANEIHFIGRKYAFDEAKEVETFEYQTIRRMNIAFHELVAPRSIAKLGAFIGAVIRARSILSLIRPAVVVGFGGYVSVPVIFAAKTLGIPTVIHEQTIHASRANKLLSWIAQHILLSWETTRAEYPGRAQKHIQVMGNPMRSIVSKDRVEDASLQVFIEKKSPPLVYITGGSTGAHAINTIVHDALDTLTRNYRVIHQCGDSQYDDYTRLSKKVHTLSPKRRTRYMVRKYIAQRDVAYIMQHADIIVSRAGINTTIEIALSGTPTILVPLALVPGGEQEHNASYFAKLGTAVVIQQDALDSETLISKLNTILSEYNSYHARASTIQKRKELSLHKDAANRVARFIQRIITHSRSNTTK